MCITYGPNKINCTIHYTHTVCQSALAYIVTAVSYTHNFLWNRHQVVGCLEEGVQGHAQEQEGDQECGGQIEMSSFEPVGNMVSICDIDFFNFHDRQV